MTARERVMARMKQKELEKDPPPPKEPNLLKVEHDDWVLCANFNPNGEWLCTGSRDKCVRMFDIEHVEELCKIKHGNWVQSVNFSHDGRLLCSACEDGHARIYDIRIQQ